MVLPDTAFTSNFTIKLAGDEQLYVADVAKKEDAQDTYNEAVKEGQTVGLVNTETRDANRLSVRYVNGYHLEITNNLYYITAIDI